MSNQRYKTEQLLGLALAIASDRRQGDVASVLRDAKFSLEHGYGDGRVRPMTVLKLYTNGNVALNSTVQKKVGDFLKTHMNPFLANTNGHIVGHSNLDSVVIYAPDPTHAFMHLTEVPTEPKANWHTLTGNIQRQRKVFISHSNEDRAFAGMLGHYLQYLDCETFVAHDNIQGGKQWSNEILARLHDMDFFIACVSEDFNSSAYCQQEVGYAVCRRQDRTTIHSVQKPEIIPLKLDKSNPKAMLAGTQASHIGRALSGAKIATIATMLDATNAWHLP